jgi:hypothetical protein
MHRALWLLMGLQLRGWLRFAKRNVSSVRGVVYLIVGLFFFFLWLFSLLFSPSAANRPNPEYVERFAPLVLLAGCVLNLLFSSGELTISFRPAEVDFLFPGPFTRRQLLLYKVAGIVAASLYQALFILIFFHNWGERAGFAYLGMVLTLLFFQFFTLTLTMTASTVGARAYSRGRKAVLVVIGLAVIAVLTVVVRSEGDVMETLARLEQSTAWHVVRAPFSWFVKAFRAEALWPDFVEYGSLALLVDLVLIAIVFALDAQYLEASAAASERQYQRLQRLRSGQGALAGPSRSGKARFSLPMLPRLGGVGPTVWRQCQVVTRSFLPFLLLIGLSGVSLAAVLGRGDLGESSLGTSATLAGMLIGFPILLTPAVLCDFRGDVDRIDVLKTLPLRPLWLAVGQLLAPTFVVVAVQTVVVAILSVVLGRVDPLLAAVPLLALPVNFILFAVENLLFLLFPVRLVATSPGDFQTSGRYMVIFFAKFICLTPIILASLLAALLVGFLTESLAAALAAAWVAAAGCGIGLVPLVVAAFKRFDVARDTPT